MRLVQALQASLSAAKRASAARSAAIRTEVPESLSRDLVPNAGRMRRAGEVGKSLELEVAWAAGP